MKTGEYTDRRGLKWYCVAQTKRERMVCNGENGSYTVACFKTFERWGWKYSQSPQISPAVTSHDREVPNAKI